MVEIPLSDVVRQVRLQWQLQDGVASAAVERAPTTLCITPRKKLFGPRSITGEEYRMVLGWLNENGYR